MPNVDRGPAHADPKNLIVVVLSVKEGMYTVGCREGILMSKFTVADLHENLLVPSDVPDVELGVRTAVRKASGGQGYQCTSGRCSCHRKNMSCNSRCHPGKHARTSRSHGRKLSTLEFP